MKLILFDMFRNPSFKMMTSFANVARTTARKVNLYFRKDFKSLGIGSLYKTDFLILNELKSSLMLKFSLQNSAYFQKFIFGMVRKVADIC